MLSKFSRNFLRTIILVIFAVSLMGASQFKGDSSSTLDREEMTLRMVQFARAGRISEARDVLKAYLNNNPSDGTMYYNLVCLDLLFNEKEQALKNFQRALENGYTNFRHIQVDSDLDLLRDDPRFEELHTRFEAEFLVNFQDRALYLDEGYCLDNISLNISNPETAKGKMPHPQMSAEFNKDALLVTVDVGDSNYSGKTAPWEDGCGILVNLIQPLSPEDYESRYYYSYGFYERDGQPTATLVGKNGKILLQDVSSLSPEIIHQGNHTRYSVSIPWDNFLPYGPPLDQEMGLNVFYFSAGSGPSRPIYSLMAEKKVSFEADSWRRYVPLYFLTSDRSVPLIQGRLYNRLSQSDELGLQMAHWAAVAGDVNLRFSVHPQNESAKIMLPPVFVDEPCEAELNFLNFYLDMAGLPEGSYNLRAELTSPTGQVFIEEYPFDNFANGWLSSLNKRVHEIKTSEQSILKYHLFKLTMQVEKRLALSDAFEFHRKYAAVEEMVEQCESGASCMPSHGLFQGGFTSGLMTQRRCTMYLPKGYRNIQNPQLMVVLPPSPGSENELATRLGSSLEGRVDVIVLVPQSHGFSGLATDSAADHTAMAIEWAMDLFHAGEVTLVGLGTGSDAALEASLRNPDLCNEVLLDGGKIYSEIVDYSGPKIVEALGARPNQVPYTILNATPASERLELFVQSMANEGFNIQVTNLKPGTSLDAWLSQMILAKH